MRFALYILLLLSCHQLVAQTTRKVLFLGNSYTSVNNLPQLIGNAAQSAGDNLIYDSYTPGGYTLQDHNQDANGTDKIKNQSWDYIVLQGQSQQPITKSWKFNGGAGALKNHIDKYNSCSVIMLYITWGRKNGDASNCAKFPVMCTYAGMDTTIRNAYYELAGDISAEVSPVSVVWQYLRNNYPGIDLYQSDGSHPSLAGSYAAACCFYTTIFKKDPTLISYNPGLSATDAATIRNAVRSQVYANINAWDFKQPPASDFNYEIGAGTNQVLLNHKFSPAVENYSWTFGDGGTSAISNPSHSYSTDGTYKITLTTTSCDLQGIHTSTSDTTIQFCSHTPTIYTKNPWVCNIDTLLTQKADAYQWVIDGVLVPETSQTLANYKKYTGSSYAVLATINGCTELSRRFSKTPDFSGYYFDIKQNTDPCDGDTVWFAALHINGSLPGTQQIFWYRNDTLLSSITNDDTMYITGPGRYKGGVVDTASKCPLDTTYLGEIKFDCATGVIEKAQDKFNWNIYPNPVVNGSFTIKTETTHNELHYELISMMGQIVQQGIVPSKGKVRLNNDLPTGNYIIKLYTDNTHGVQRLSILR